MSVAPLAEAFVRLRPSLSPADRDALEELGRTARSLADGVDAFLNRFVPEPESLERESSV